MTLPFLTVPDPKTTSEGVLDPLGLSGVGDQLADEILPGLRARMVRPRFLTAMAVSAAVYEGLEDELARTMPIDRILTCRCDTTLVGRGRSSD